MAFTPISPLPTGLEMFQKGHVDAGLFHARTYAPRPLSEATEMYDTDFEDDFEDLDDDVEINSPRNSIQSTSKKSVSTLSSYDEAITPISNHFAAFDFQLDSRPVEGPRGPHLFRASQDSTHAFSSHLEMSPLTPKTPYSRPVTAIRAPPLPVVTARRPPYVPDEDEVREWSPREVAMWMYNTGFEESVIEKFTSNDISGAILVDLKFEDLKELDIQSFGKRRHLWKEIRRIRGSPLSSPVDESPSSDGSDHSPDSQDGCFSPATGDTANMKRHRSRRNRRQQAAGGAVLTPAESVSIVGIEQLIPKPHKCSKGENCSKFRRQQRQLALLAKEHPISPEHGGRIIITGNPGNASTAESVLRPVSDAVPSVVASSDVFGPEPLPPIQLQEDHLRAVQARDPQENVKHFLTFQHVQTLSPEDPTTPPFEMFPPLHNPPRLSGHDNLRSLPKLTIPQSRPVTAASPTSTIVPSKIHRFGTPCSAMDVPVTAVPLGPVARDFSQSVPPDMRYRRSPPSPAVRRRDSWQPSFGMTKLEENVHLEAVEALEEPLTTIKDVNHAGWMKKRKTKFLRHEWQEHHFTLNGTNLDMRQDPRSSAVLEHIDVDDYAIACSSLASSKLSAAFKSMKLTGKRDVDSMAFAFQLVPAAEKKGIRHAATGKTHHFAVKSRDERIDWMRELMLAKAVKQKGEGYQINVNGNVV